MGKCYHEIDYICSISEGKRKCADLDKSPFCEKNIQIMTTIDYFRCKNCNNLFKESDLITTLDGKELCKICWIDNYKCQACGKDLKEKDTVTTIDNKIICHECWIKEDSNYLKVGSCWHNCCECGEVMWFDEKKDIICGSCQTKIQKHNQDLIKQLEKCELFIQQKPKRKVKAWVYLIWYDFDTTLGRKQNLGELSNNCKDLTLNDFNRFIRHICKEYNINNIIITNWKLLRKEYEEASKCKIEKDKTDDKTGIEITIDNLKCCMNCWYKIYDANNKVYNTHCQEWAGKGALTEYCGGWEFDGLSVDKRNIYR